MIATGWPGSVKLSTLSMRTTDSFSPRMLTLCSSSGIVIAIDSVPVGATALTPPGPAPPPMRSTRSAAVRNSFCTTARESRLLFIVSTPMVAVYRRYPRFVLTSSSEYMWRLWRSKVSVASPTWSGTATMMPSAGSRPVNTSQKVSLVCTPWPSGFGHVIVAGSVCMAGSGGGATGRRAGARVCALGCCALAWAVLDSARAMAALDSARARAADNSAITIAAGMLRMSVAHAREAGRRLAGQRRQAADLQQLQELHPRARVVAERAEHRAGDRERVLLLHAAHRHAEVRPLADDGDAERIDLLADRLGDLVRHPLLDLQAAGEHVDQPRNLAEADDPLARDVRDVALAEEQQEVVLAERVEVDVLDDHHLAIIDGEQRIVQHVIDVSAISARQEFQRLLHARGRPDEPLAIGVFAQLDEQAPDEI